MAMSMANSLITYSSTSHHFRPQNLSYGSILFLAITRNKTATSWKRNNQVLLQKENTTKRKSLVVCSSAQSGVPLPPGPPSSSWKSWILAIVFAVVLPFFTNKWGPILKLKNKVETTVETAEEVVKTVEKVADGVEKVAENVAHQLPEGGKLRYFVVSVEKVAEAADKDAHLVGNFIEKAEKLEVRVESLVDSINDEAIEPPKTKQARDLK